MKQTTYIGYYNSSDKAQRVKRPKSISGKVIDVIIRAAVSLGAAPILALEAAGRQL